MGVSVDEIAAPMQHNRQGRKDDWRRSIRSQSVSARTKLQPAFRFFVTDVCYIGPDAMVWPMTIVIGRLEQGVVRP
jgi:hypothetical protein